MEGLIAALPLNWAAAGTGAGAGFFMVKWFAEWLSGRIDRRETAVDGREARLDATTSRLIEKLEKRMDDLTERLDRAEHELIECRAAHAQCESELTRLRAMVQGFGDAKQHAQLIVSAEKVIQRVAKSGETE